MNLKSPAIALPHQLGALTIVLLLAMVLARVAILHRRGIVATKFGVLDKSDFIIPPFAFLYFYLVFASALHWPSLTHRAMFASSAAAWGGVAICALGLVLMAAALAAFGASFRIGIDADHPDRLITTGVFAVSRNPVYLAFAMVLAGEFLILPHWLPLLYLLAGVALFHRQTLREEAYLSTHYGNEYASYCKRVRRYL